MQLLSMSQITAQFYATHSSGPIAILFIEDATCLSETLSHYQNLGFTNIFALGAVEHKPYKGFDNCVWVDVELHSNQTVVNHINAFIKAFPNRWIYHSFNAEFLYFPFCETRKISDFIGFLDEERRITAFSTTVDLYPEAINHDHTDYNTKTAMLDSLGYYAQSRRDQFGPKSRQIDVYGGLRWRFEEFIPWERRRINNVRLVKSAPDLVLGDDFIFNQSEYETYQSEWHNSPSLAVCSFRATKFLLNNPGPRERLEKFKWPNSVKYEATANQLLALGLMEPGQWF